jgi:hypothetical protein
MDVPGFEERGEGWGEGMLAISFVVTARSRLMCIATRNSFARLIPHPSPLPEGERA